MNYFFDSSALVKRFFVEPGSRQVSELLDGPCRTIWLSELSLLEIPSAFYRRYRNREVTEGKLKEAIDGFYSAVASYEIAPLSSDIVAEASGLLAKFGKSSGLRSLDALHLGTLNFIGNSSWIVVSADYTMCSVAKKMGNKTVCPV
jgi:predicted nucleic acid-binding protein